MPNTAVVGESRAQSRSADSSTHPTSSRAKESAHGSVASPSTAVTGQMMSSASRSRTNASSGVASTRPAAQVPPPVCSARR
ncbi:hypothetical protein [Streptomyces griseoluteus]|uniref:hypothetical protein n=1 Tax=Streptomyces griseoluteus TaxID=29306 RepID=UPI00380488ED